MRTTHSLQISPFQALAWTLGWFLRFIVLVMVYFALFAASGRIVAPYLPNVPAEPGPVPLMTGFWISCTAITLVVMAMVYSSRWHGWKLVGAMSIAYYLVVTVVTQLEAWYFLYGVTIGPELMARLFLQGLPVAFLFIPLTVLVMGRFRDPGLDAPEARPMPLKEWLWKLAAIYLAYLVLYFAAGHFIAWQNPEVRAFYGSPGPALPFLAQMLHIVQSDPWLIPYQLIRTLIWVAGALPILRGSRLPLWQTALIVGLALSVPQNIGHLLPNPVIPLNSVRISHMVETASSTFVFGLIVTWLLYPRHSRSR